MNPYHLPLCPGKKVGLIFPDFGIPGQFLQWEWFLNLQVSCSCVPNHAWLVCLLLVFKLAVLPQCILPLWLASGTALRTEFCQNLGGRDGLGREKQALIRIRSRIHSHNPFFWTACLWQIIGLPLWMFKMLLLLLTEPVTLMCILHWSRIIGKDKFRYLFRLQILQAALQRIHSLQMLEERNIV